MAQAGGSAKPEPEPGGPERDQLRRRQVIGILLLVALIVAFSLLRARWHDVFPRGWWRW
ncbi:MAG: hypothetical protein ACLGXA_08310 [Acidobacteriota bacterium]